MHTQCHPQNRRIGSTSNATTAIPAQPSRANNNKSRKKWHFLLDYNNSLWKRQIGIIALVTFCAQNKCTFRRLRAVYFLDCGRMVSEASTIYTYLYRRWLTRVNGFGSWMENDGGSNGEGCTPPSALSHSIGIDLLRMAERCWNGHRKHEEHTNGVCMCRISVRAIMNFALMRGHGVGALFAFKHLLYVFVFVCYMPLSAWRD